MLDALDGMIEADEDGRLKVEPTETYGLEIVGEASYQDAFIAICGPRKPSGHRHLCEAVIEAEPSNPVNSKAVRVSVSGRTIGYLSEVHTAQWHKAMSKLGCKGKPIHANCLIVGGWTEEGKKKPPATEGYFGAKLDIDYSENEWDEG